MGVADAQKIVDFLNELVEIDRPAITALIANRVPCNERLADHPTVQVATHHDGYSVGLLGILNGLCGIQENGYGYIAAEFYTKEDANKFKNLKGFVLYLKE